jgi:hypothetical protein
MEDHSLLGCPEPGCRGSTIPQQSIVNVLKSDRLSRWFKELDSSCKSLLSNLKADLSASTVLSKDLSREDLVQNFRLELPRFDPAKHLIRERMAMASIMSRAFEDQVKQVFDQPAFCEHYRTKLTERSNEIATSLASFNSELEVLEQEPREAVAEKVVGDNLELLSEFAEAQSLVILRGGISVENQSSLAPEGNTSTGLASTDPRQSMSIGFLVDMPTDSMGPSR